MRGYVIDSSTCLIYLYVAWSIMISESYLMFFPAKQILLGEIRAKLLYHWDVPLSKC